MTVRTFFNLMEDAPGSPALSTTSPTMYDLSDLDVDNKIGTVQGRRVRSASVSDAVDLGLVTQNPDVNKMVHVMKINPQSKADPLVKADRNVKKWICSHPGCGKVFSSHLVASMHEKDHKLRQRLAVTTPKTDQFLRSVWPTDVPWQNEEQMVPLLKDAAPFSCPIEVHALGATTHHKTLSLMR